MLAAALGALLAVAGDDEQRVVDPEREAHPREHVHEEDRELELLGEDGAEPERDDDRDDRHHQRHEPGDDRPEDEEEDDERGREAELELAVLQVLLGEEVEVVVERLRAGHRHGERAVIVDGLDLLDERLRLVVVEERDRDDRRVAILRDETGARVVEVRVGARPRAVISSSSTNARTNASNCGESTAYASERMTTMSVTAVAGSGGNAASSEPRRRAPIRDCSSARLRS